MTTNDSWGYHYVPPAAIRLFRLTWQLETWLRTMVYVELRASRVDWEEPIKKAIGGRNPKDSDKKLHHMATPHEADLSYLTFGQLWDIISNSWPLFEPYFPPKNNTEVRIEEIKQIRHRVAHFREPHANDERRLALFLDDLEPGIRRFCIRYKEDKLATDPEHDPVSDELKKHWDRLGYGVELLSPRGWLYAPGRHRDNPQINATLHLHTHNNYIKGSLQGVVYRLRFSPNGTHGQFDTGGFLAATKGLHKEVIHLLVLGDGFPPEVTIPAILGVDATVELIGKFLRSALDYCSSYSRQTLDRSQWPEYVLWPDHMLTFFSQDVREPMVDTK